jgi:hypothetical protein
MPPREFQFTLPVGYLDPQGNIHREIILRKMTGHEEILMSDPTLAKNGGQLFTEILTHCLRRLGNLPSISREQVALLSSPDRDFLMVKLRAITFGNQYEMTYSCPTCTSVVRCIHHLDTFPLKETGEFSGEIQVELEDGYEDKEELHTQMTFRLPNGKDEEVTVELARQNLSRAKNAILTRCLKQFGKISKERLQALGTKIFMDLTMGDRRKIDKAFESQIPGLKLQQELICSECQTPFSIRVDLGNFLFPA